MNKVKKAIRANVSVRGVHLTYPAAHTIALLSQMALDFVYLDAEHGSFDLLEIWRHCRIAEGLGITPIARVPDKSSATITKFLDQGVKGIIVPHIESADEAREVAAASYFAPMGERSYGGGFPSYTRDKAELPSYLQERNAGVSLSVMIESRAGLEAIEEIAEVQGIDYLSFGMMDLAQSLGHSGNPQHPDIVAAVARASDKVRGKGKPLREDFMRFAWIEDILISGYKQLIDDVPQKA